MSNFTQQNNFKSNGYSNNEYKENVNQISVLAAENLELRNRIHQSNEMIFDLQSSMVTLEAESKFQVENELKKINAESIFKQRDFDVLNQEHQNTLKELAALKQAMRSNSSNVNTQPIPVPAPVTELRSDTKNGTTPKNNFTAHNNNSSRFNQTSNSNSSNATPHTTSSSSSSHITPSTAATDRTSIKVESDATNNTSNAMSAQDALLAAATQKASKSALRILSALNGQYQALLLSLSSTEQMISTESASRLSQLMNNGNTATSSTPPPSFTSSTLTPLKKTSSSTSSTTTAVSTPQSTSFVNRNNSSKSNASAAIKLATLASFVIATAIETDLNCVASDSYHSAQREVLNRLTELGAQLRDVMGETISSATPHYTLNVTSLLMTLLQLCRSLHSTLLLATPTAAALIGDTTTTTSSVEEGGERGSAGRRLGVRLKDVYSREVEVNGGKGLRGLFHVKNNHTNNNTNNNNYTSNTTKHPMTMCLELLTSVLIVLNADINITTSTSSLQSVTKEVLRGGGDLRSKFEQVATNNNNLSRSGSVNNNKSANNSDNTSSKATTSNNTTSSTSSSGAKRKLSITNDNQATSNNTTNSTNYTSNQPLPLPSFFLALTMPNLSDSQKLGLLGTQYVNNNTTSNTNNNTLNNIANKTELIDCSLFTTQFTTLCVDIIKSAYVQAQNSKFILAAEKVHLNGRQNKKNKKKLYCVQYRTEMLRNRTLPLSLLSSDVEVIATLFEMLTLLVNRCDVGGTWSNNDNKRGGVGVGGGGIGCDLLPLLLTNREDTKTINKPTAPDHEYTLDTLPSDHFILTSHALPALIKVMRDTSLPLSLQRGAVEMLSNAVCSNWSLYRRLVTDQQHLTPQYDPDYYPENEVSQGGNTTITTSDALDGVGVVTVESHSSSSSSSQLHDDDCLLGTNRTNSSLLVALSERLADRDACYTGAKRAVSRGRDQGSGGCDVEVDALEYKIQIAQFFLQLVKKYSTTAVNWIAGRTPEEVFEGVVEVEEEVSHRMDVEDHHRNTTPLSSAAKRSNTNSNTNHNNQQLSDSQQGAMLRRTHSVQGSTTNTGSNTNSASKHPKTPITSHNTIPMQTPQTATSATPSRSGVYRGATFPVFKPFSTSDHARPQHDVVNAIITCLKDHIRILDTTVSCHVVSTGDDDTTPLSSVREMKMEENLVTLCYTLIELLDTIACVMVDEMVFEELITERSDDLNCALCRAFVDNLHSSLVVKSSMIRHLGEE